MIRVTLSDGKTYVDFPDGTNPAEIKTAMAKKFYRAGPEIMQGSKTEQRRAEPLEESFKPVKTPLGMALTAIGMPKERLVKAMSSSENPLYSKTGEMLANMVPYEITPQEAALGMVSEIKAFHGSPHKFKNFSNEAIGTGEGAQAFGYGHYVSEAPEVAKQYSLTGIKLGDTEITPKSMWYNPFKRMINQEQGWNEGTLIKALEEAVDNWGVESRIGKESNKFLQKIRTGEKPLPSGSIYETTIHKGKQPSEYRYLEWDKPVSNDTLDKIGNELVNQFGYRVPGGPAVETLKTYLADVKARKGLRLTGNDMYGFLRTHLNGEKQASNFLQKAGFSGIKYPTGSLSGMKGTGKYNYVVFDPEDITIEAVK